MRVIAVEEKDIKVLMEKLELVKLEIHDETASKRYTVDKIHRRFHYVVCSWVQEHGSNYPNN